jgi:hypothetical protein
LALLGVDGKAGSPPHLGNEPALNHRKLLLAIPVAVVVGTIVMVMMPIMVPSVRPIPIAAALIMAMNPTAPIAIAGNPYPLIPVVPVVRPEVKSSVTHTD